MTTVLPEPVAILRAIRGRPGLDWSFASRSWFSIQASPYFLATSAMSRSGLVQYSKSLLVVGVVGEIQV